MRSSPLRALCALAAVAVAVAAASVDTSLPVVARANATHSRSHHQRPHQQHAGRGAAPPLPEPAAAIAVGGDHVDIWVIPHTHDDVGWLETVDEYYIQQVQWIFDTFVRCLADNPDRRFTYVEVAYFKRWWLEQDEPTKTLVRSLVANGQLEFNLGGWCVALSVHACTFPRAPTRTLTVAHLHDTFAIASLPC
jgi:hypothetical protein